MNLSTGQSKSADASFILIAEDNPADVGLIRMALTRHGIVHDVRILPDGEAALHFIEQVEADESARCPLLAVLDLNLPRVSGDQVLGRLRSSATWRNVPVIVMSSSLSLRDQEEALALGATAYFSKPSELERFLELGSLIKSLLPSRETGGVC